MKDVRIQHNVTALNVHRNLTGNNESVTKNLEKLLGKLAAFVESREELYGIRLVYHGQVKMKQVKKPRRKLYALKEAEGIEFVHGTGK